MGVVNGDLINAGVLRANHIISKCAKTIIVIVAFTENFIFAIHVQ